MRVLIASDLNVDVRSQTASVRDFLNMLRSHNVFCMNFEPTRGDKCLDNIFTDMYPEKVN